MPSTTFAFTDAAVSLLGPVPFGFGTYGFYHTNQTGRRVAFEVGPIDTLVLDGQANSNGATPFDLYVDGVLQTAPVFANSRSDVTAWTGTLGTHTFEVVWNGSDDGYLADTSAFKATAATGTPAISRPAGWGDGFTIAAGSGTTGIVAEAFPFNGNTGQGDHVFTAPDESFHFRATGLDLLKILIAPFSTGTLTLTVQMDDGDPVAVTTSSIASFTRTLVDLSSALPAHGGTTHDYYVGLVGWTGSSSAFACAVMLTTGALINTAPTVHRDILFFEGDSLTNVQVSLGSSYDGFANRTGRRLNAAVANYGVNGKNTQTMASEVAAAIAALVRPPAAMYLMTGRNDVFQSVTTANHKTYFADTLTAMLGAVATVPLDVVLMPYTNSSANNTIDDGYITKQEEAIGENGSGRIASFDPRGVLTQPGDWLDGAHLNAGGQLKLADMIAPANAAPDAPTVTVTPFTLGRMTVGLTGSAFTDADGGDTHAATQWQVTTTADTGYAAPVFDPGDDATNLTARTVTGLTPATAYRARARYKDSAGNYSAYSASATFTTTFQPTLTVGTPTATGVTLTGSAFPMPGVTHAASRWQVAPTADVFYSTPAVDTGDDATHLTSYAAMGLTASTAYRAKVTYKDSAGEYSSQSDDVTFTTAAAPATLTAGTASFVSSGPTGISVAATAPTGGSGSLSYQWERNADGGAYADVSGATSLTLTDATATTADVLYGYRCKQAKGAGTVTTNAVTAEVYAGGDIGTGGADTPSDTYSADADLDNAYGPDNVTAWADLNDNADATEIAARKAWGRGVAYRWVNSKLRGAGLTAPATADNFSEFDLLADVEAERAGAILYQSRGVNDRQQASGDTDGVMQAHFEHAEAELDRLIGVVTANDGDDGTASAGTFQFIPITRGGRSCGDEYTSN